MTGTATSEAAAAAPAVAPLSASIRASRARLALTCAAATDIRYYLNGILVEPRADGGVFIVGTDGHTLIAVIDESGTCSRAVLLTPNQDTVRKLPRINSKGDTGEARLELTEFRSGHGLLLCDHLGLPCHMQVTDACGDLAAMFPLWRKVLPNFGELKAGAQATLDPHYVARVLAAFSGSTHRRSGWPMLRPFQAVAHGSITYQIVGHEYAVLLVMPINDDQSHRDQWIQRWTKERASTKPTWANAAQNNTETTGATP